MSVISTVKIFWVKFKIQFTCLNPVLIYSIHLFPLPYFLLFLQVNLWLELVPHLHSLNEVTQLIPTTTKVGTKTSTAHLIPPLKMNYLSHPLQSKGLEWTQDTYAIFKLFVDLTLI